MNLDDLRDENNIVDPNLARKQPGTQTKGTKRIVTPKDMGYTHKEEPKYARPEDPILDRMDEAIARRQREAKIMADAIEESDGEGISEEEFQDILVQRKDEIESNDFIPTEEELSKPSRKPDIKAVPNIEMNKVTSIIEEMEDDFDDEDEDDDDDEYIIDKGFTSSTSKISSDPDTSTTVYVPETELEPAEHAVATKIDANSINNDSSKRKATDPLSNSEYNPFKNFVSGDINFDEENEELDENDDRSLAEKEQQEQVDKLRVLIREKIKPVSEALDISTFSISKRPAPSNISTPRAKKEKIGDWVLMSSQRPIYMTKFTGTELDRLGNGGKGRTRLNQALDTWQLIYNHIVDPYKPADMIEWSKVTSFLDIDHIYMAMYRANFEGTNFVPYNCSNDGCKEVFLSDSIDVMDMCKFNKKEDKEKFLSILGTETNETSRLYSTEVVPVSDDYAFVFREPSIYNIIFESAVLDADWVDKFGDLVTICSYIDDIYYINRETRELQPVRTNVYQNNMKKTAKSRIINFSKIISTLNPDQYSTLIAYMQKINEGGDALTYQLPEVTCPKCGTTIEARPTDAQGLVFTRHQLAALATL